MNFFYYESKFKIKKKNFVLGGRWGRGWLGERRGAGGYS